MLYAVALGFSARSLLKALTTSGFKGIGVDQFGDQDALDVAEDVLVTSGWQAAAGSTRPMDMQAIVKWLRTWLDRGGRVEIFPLLAGGIETWPELLAVLHDQFTVLGPTAGQLSQLRDLQFWHDSASEAGIGFPSTFDPSITSSSLQPLMMDGGEPRRGAVGWLLKARHAAGGVHIRRLDHSPHPENPSFRAPEDYDSRDSRLYCQREIHGRSLGVTLAMGQAGKLGNCRIVGATESLSFRDWPAPTEFIYRGSLGPIRLSQRQQRRLVRWGQWVHAQTGTLGCLQADFIEDAMGQWWLLEINPRWTAGMEILQLVGRSPILAHLRAARPETDELVQHAQRRHCTGGEGANHRATSYAGKAVVYTCQEITLTAQRLRFLHSLPRAHFADIPSQRQLGQSLPIGSPLLSVRCVERASRSADWPRIRTGLLEQLFALEKCLSPLRVDE